MRVKKILLTNFRNHTGTALEFSDGANFITGANAQGKTSILEAISYVCLTKSFLQPSDKTVCLMGADSFTVEATMENDHGIANRARVVYETAAGKKYFLDNNEIRRSSYVIGMFPIVVLSPWDFALTTGAPSERRKFVDIVLSQASRSYLEELIEYRRALKQRNRILMDAKFTGVINKDLLGAWTSALVDHGAKVIMKRKEFIKDFQSAFTAAYASLTEGGEIPRLVYEPSFKLSEGMNVSDITAMFYGTIERLSNVEHARGSTLAGPHRDDIGFLLNGAPIREFASQGQHKTFLVALKIAEFHYMKSKLNETPTVLLDDVMTELDYARASKTIRSISELGQTFITATDMLNIDEELLGTHETKIHFVQGGNVIHSVQDTMLGVSSITGGTGVGNE